LVSFGNTIFDVCANVSAALLGFMFLYFERAKISKKCGLGVYKSPFR